MSELTHDNGRKVGDNENSLTVGPQGPITVQDVLLFEKMGHFNREVIPERRMHAKGWGAYGTFTCTNDITKWTKAKVFQPGKKTKVFVRFSTVAGERGYPDADRDIRGFAMRYYTEDGNWDLVGNNTPVFFVRDGQNFPGLNRAIKRHPQTGRRDKTSQWDFWTYLPEALHQITITMSDRGIPASFQNMHGFGSHTFSFFNEKNEHVWCKFHLLTEQGIKNISEEDAEILRSKDPDSHGHLLFDAIENHAYPKWKFYVQIMTEDEANHLDYNPFDITKVWYHKDFPLIPVGELELNQNPQNFFAEVEQAAFDPAHIVEGIGWSYDKLLQSRLFSYSDAQRYRLGVNYPLLPINQPITDVCDNYRDGAMRFGTNYGSSISYTPNSKGLWMSNPCQKETPSFVCGKLYRYDPKVSLRDDFTEQPGKLYRLLTEEKKRLLIHNTSQQMIGVPEVIKIRHSVHCYLADPDYGKRLCEEMNLDYNQVVQYSFLTNKELNQITSLKKASQ
jgi:catalase